MSGTIRHVNKFSSRLAGLALVGVGLAPSALASHPGESGAVIACGRLESFQGNVQVFDAARTSTIDVKPNQKLQCGDWISVVQGKAIIRHKLGFQVTLGAGSFLQILDPQSGENPEKDHFALYRGQGLFKASEKDPELKVATANARARFRNSEGYFLYSYDFHVSQLVGIQGRSRLENRFLDARPIAVARSQVTSMGELGSRPVPRLARTVSMASVKERLARLGVTADLQKQMVDQMKVLAETRMPAKLESERSSGERRPASVAPVESPSAQSLAHFELSRPKPEHADDENPIPAKRAVSSVRSAGKKSGQVARHEVYPAEESAASRGGSSREETEKQRLLRKLSEIEPE